MPFPSRSATFFGRPIETVLVNADSPGERRHPGRRSVVSPDPRRSRQLSIVQPRAQALRHDQDTRPKHRPLDALLYQNSAVPPLTSRAAATTRRPRRPSLPTRLPSPTSVAASGTAPGRFRPLRATPSTSRDAAHCLGPATVAEGDQGAGGPTARFPAPATHGQPPMRRPARRARWAATEGQGRPAPVAATPARSSARSV